MEIRIKPKKFLGQNFLTNERIVFKIIDTLDKDSNILEVGTGKGMLTRHLAKEVKYVVSVEKDNDLVRAYEEGKYSFLKVPNLRIIEKDVLELEEKELTEEFLTDYHLVGNLPYNISKKILVKFLDGNFFKPKTITVMLQKEVGEQILGKKKSFMTFFTDLFCFQKQIVTLVGKSEFYPIPKVDSIVIKLFVRNEEELDQFLKEINLKKNEIERFWKFLKYLLLFKRKKLGASLKSFNKESFELVKNNENYTQIIENRVDKITFEEAVLLYRTFTN